MKPLFLTFVENLEHLFVILIMIFDQIESRASNHFFEKRDLKHLLSVIKLHNEFVGVSDESVVDVLKKT